MDMFYIPALASFSGSASGTLASIVTGWVTQRRKDRVRHTLRATSQREELYKNFIEEASRLYADALVNDKSEVSKLVDLYALIARMKILSSDAVIEAAEKAGRLILDTYLSPNRTFVDLPDLINEMDPLRDFSEACRRELQSARSALRLLTMPLFQYFGWVGSFLLAALFAANWCCSAPTARAPRSDVPLNQRINIRIHTDHKWPERVVFDTTAFDIDAKKPKRRPTSGRARLSPRRNANLSTRSPRWRLPRQAVFSTALLRRPGCGAGGLADRKGAPSQNRSRIAARKGLTFPNPLHKPPGRS